jgi:hypothetical protein
MIVLCALTAIYLRSDVDNSDCCQMWVLAIFPDAYRDLLRKIFIPLKIYHFKLVSPHVFSISETKDKTFKNDSFTAQDKKHTIIMFY